uniref:Trophoblast glycoprotein n=1 Tax=Chelonoidis abingdonii TaxID=106734 RepID=A0A8C0HAQ4_CHEAB
GCGWGASLYCWWAAKGGPGSCPAPCECSEAARTVKCVNRNLTAVPPDLPPYARLLFLTGNRLSSLPPCAFLSLAQLQSLDLSHNSLKCLKNATITQLRSRPALRRINIQSQLQTSYVFLGIVLALIGAIFLLVLYLNRKGIKKWMYNIRDACRDHMEGYHYRYEVNADPRLTNLSSSSDV